MKTICEHCGLETNVVIVNEAKPAAPVPRALFGDPDKTMAEMQALEVLANAVPKPTYSFKLKD
jgi:hypothetical protein